MRSCIRPGCSVTRDGLRKSGGDFYYYREGITRAIAAWIEEVDKERLEIVKQSWV